MYACFLYEMSVCIIINYEAVYTRLLNGHLRADLTLPLYMQINRTGTSFFHTEEEVHVEHLLNLQGGPNNEEFVRGRVSQSLEYEFVKCDMFSINKLSSSFREMSVNGVISINRYLTVL